MATHRRPPHPPRTGASSRPALEQDATGDDRLPGNDADTHAGRGPRPRPRPESLPCLVASFRRDSPAPMRARRVRAPRPGLPLIGDKGFAGQESEDLATAGFGLRPVRPTAAARRRATYRSTGSGRRSSRSMTPSRASSTSNATAAAPAGHGRVHLAQLAHGRAGHPLAYRIQPLNPSGITRPDRLR